jgi:hypothetical protein
MGAPCVAPNGGARPARPLSGQREAIAARGDAA